MKNKRLTFLILISLLNIAAASRADALPIDRITMPDGFSISIYAENIENARSMTLTDSGILIVGTRKNDKVFALLDTDNDNVAETVHIIDKGLNTPNGVAIKDGDLYVAEVSRILKYADIENTYATSPQPEVIYDAYPTDKWHGWKYIAFGPDGYLYVPVGAPCNICEKENPIYASITRLNVETGTLVDIYAHGVRNTVGFTWHPETKELWFTDNGRDWYGDNRPPDELNRAPRADMHFGFPYVHGTGIPDDEYYEKRPPDITFTSPEQDLGPHVAALGMTFYRHDQFPEKYKKGVFIAEHGSWNRSTPIGARVMFVPIEDNTGTGYEVFAEGWQYDNGDRFGRPVDVLVMTDGSLLVSDDMGNAIYRITYDGD